LSIQVLRDLRGLRVQVIHAPDEEGVGLVDQFRRIGCTVEANWPVPDGFAANADVVVLSIDYDNREQIQRALKSQNGKAPTLIAIVGYENPATLQIVIESGALAVIERPIRPFGLLTNVILARTLWLERHEEQRRLRKLERKLSGIQKIQRAKSILMAGQSISEEDAYQSIRRQAMAKRVPMEEMAGAIINANELLNFRSKND
jgi:AmiR/NasT family two-component response regulator